VCKEFCLALVLSAAVVLTASNAQAVPIALLGSSDAGGQLIQVRDGCGLGRLPLECRWRMLVAPVAMGSAPDLQLVTDAARSPVICTVRSFCDGRTRAKLFGVVLFQDRGSPQ